MKRSLPHHLNTGSNQNEYQNKDEFSKTMSLGTNQGKAPKNESGKQQTVTFSPHV